MAKFFDQILFSSGPLLAGQSVNWQPPWADGGNSEGSVTFFLKVSMAMDGSGDDFNNPSTITATQNGQTLATISAPGFTDLGLGGCLFQTVAAAGVVTFTNAGPTNLTSLTVQNFLDRTAG